MIRVVKTVALLCALLSTSLSFASEPLIWAGCGITKKSFMAELASAYKAKYGTEIVLEGGGAAKGIRRVGDKSADIGGSCRPKLPGRADELSTQLNPVAWDALVVIVHPDNPVNNITIAQLRRMFEGKIHNWKELGGKDQPLELQVRRGKFSGVGRTLRELAFGDFDKDFVASAVHKSSGPLEKAVVSNPNAVGVTGVSSARKRNVKILTLEGKEPSYDNIRSGEYLFYRPLYIAHNPSSPRYDEVKRFIDFAHSREGRKIIRKQGVVPYLDALHLIRKQREQWQHSLELMKTSN
jgi:phosphate transport system substrate-binding protein